jgi:hypothetical protein
MMTATEPTPTPRKASQAKADAAYRARRRAAGDTLTRVWMTAETRADLHALQERLGLSIELLVRNAIAHYGASV